MHPLPNPQWIPTLVLAGEEPELLLLLHSVLSETTEHISVVSVHYGRDVLNLVKTRTVRLLVTRETLPDMNGIALTQRVRATNQKTRVALISRNANPQDEAAARMAGATFYLPLPLKESDFTQMVRTALK